MSAKLTSEISGSAANGSDGEDDAFDAIMASHEHCPQCISFLESRPLFGKHRCVGVFPAEGEIHEDELPGSAACDVRTVIERREALRERLMSNIDAFGDVIVHRIPAAAVEVLQHIIGSVSAIVKVAKGYYDVSFSSDLVDLLVSVFVPTEADRFA